MPVDQPVIDGRTEVLVVDDDEMLADLFAEWVEEKWHCRAVNSGRDAVEAADADTDVVLLDRQMPGMGGEEVLAALREAELDLQAMMISGVAPGLDLLELSIGDYLQKPVDRPTLQAAIEGLLIRRTYTPLVQRFYNCARKLEILEAAVGSEELAGSEAYVELKVTADELRQTADATLGKRSDHAAALSNFGADD